MYLRKVWRQRTLQILVWKYFSGWKDDDEEEKKEDEEEEGKKKCVCQGGDDGKHRDSEETLECKLKLS